MMTCKADTSMTLKSAFMRWMVRTDKKLVKSTIKTFALNARITPETVLNIYFFFKLKL